MRWSLSTKISLAFLIAILLFVTSSLVQLRGVQILRDQMVLQRELTRVQASAQRLDRKLNTVTKVLKRRIGLDHPWTQEQLKSLTERGHSQNIYGQLEILEQRLERASLNKSFPTQLLDSVTGVREHLRTIQRDDTIATQIHNDPKLRNALYPLKANQIGPDSSVFPVLVKALFAARENGDRAKVLILNRATREHIGRLLGTGSRRGQVGLAGFKNKMSRLNSLFKTSLQNQTDQSSKKIFVFHGVSLAVAIILFIGVILGLRPVRRLIEGVRAMGRGNLDAAIPIQRNDEIGQLAAEFNEMAKSLKQHQQALLRAERLAAVGKMAANVAHEIRNPLNAIALNVELTEDAIADGELESTQPLLQTVRKEVERLTEVTESYLRFSALPSPRKEPVDIASIARDLVAFQSEVAKRGGVSLTVHTPGELMANADPDQIRQALLNLIRNGIEATGDKGNVRVEVQALRKDGESRCQIHVLDDGPGVPEEVATQMFEPFYSTKKHGTGLGLALVSKVADAHGGSLTYKDVDGHNRGAHFTMELVAEP